MRGEGGGGRYQHLVAIVKFSTVSATNKMFLLFGDLLLNYKNRDVES